MLISSNVGMAYDNEHTHPDVLTAGAVDVISPAGSDSTYPEIRSYLDPTSGKGMRDGSNEEDNLPNPIHHFYNPFTHDGLFGAQDAYDYVPQRWNAAINEY